MKAVVLSFVAAVAMCQTTSAQEASVLELVEECDILAAHPDDPERMADGIADDEIVPRLAILACEKSAADSDHDPRFHFQLGRALLAANRKQDAIARFERAADAGYAAAWAYLGDAHQFGIGVPVDAKKAFDAYKKAYDGGFEAAKEQIAQLQFDPSMYTGEFLSLFFNSNFGPIDQKSRDSGLSALVRNYVFNLVLTISTDCGNVLQAGSVHNFYQYRYPPTWSAQSDDNVSVAIQTSVAEQDAQKFKQRHGCEGAVAKHVFQQMNSFFSQRR